MEEVRQSTRGQQIPRTEGNFIKSDFYFYPPVVEEADPSFEKEFEEIEEEITAYSSFISGLKKLKDKVNQFAKSKFLELKKIEIKFKNFLPPDTEPHKFSKEHQQVFEEIVISVFMLIEELKSIALRQVS